MERYDFLNPRNDVGRAYETILEAGCLVMQANDGYIQGVYCITPVYKGELLVEVKEDGESIKRS